MKFHTTKIDISPFFDLQKSAEMTGKNSVLYDLPGCLDLIIRKSFVNPFLTEDTHEEALRVLIRRIKAFQEVAQKYSLRVAKTWYVIGHDPVSKHPSLFAVTERISGKNLDEIFSFDENIQNELDEMFASIFLNLWKSYHHGGYIWSDFNKGQVVCGIAPREMEKHLYLVDVDPLVELWHKEWTLQQESLFWEQVYRVAVSMKQTEQAGCSGLVFHKKARDWLDFIFCKVTVPKNEEIQDRYVSIAGILRR